MNSIKNYLSCCVFPILSVVLFFFIASCQIEMPLHHPSGKVVVEDSDDSSFNAFYWSCDPSTWSDRDDSTFTVIYGKHVFNVEGSSIRVIEHAASDSSRTYYWASESLNENYPDRILSKFLKSSNNCGLWIDDDIDESQNILIYPHKIQFNHPDHASANLRYSKNLALIAWMRQNGKIILVDNLSFHHRDDPQPPNLTYGSGNSKGWYLPINTNATPDDIAQFEFDLRDYLTDSVCEDDCPDWSNSTSTTSSSTVSTTTSSPRDVVNVTETTPASSSQESSDQDNVDEGGLPDSGETITINLVVTPGTAIEGGNYLIRANSNRDAYEGGCNYTTSDTRGYTSSGIISANGTITLRKNIQRDNADVDATITVTLTSCSLPDWDRLDINYSIGTSVATVTVNNSDPPPVISTPPSTTESSTPSTQSEDTTPEPETSTQTEDDTSSDSSTPEVFTISLKEPVSEITEGEWIYLEAEFDKKLPITCYYTTSSENWGVKCGARQVRIGYTVVDSEEGLLSKQYFRDNYDDANLHIGWWANTNLLSSGSHKAVWIPDTDEVETGRTLTVEIYEFYRTGGPFPYPVTCPVTERDPVFGPVLATTVPPCIRGDWGIWETWSVGTGTFTVNVIDSN